jgi:hypothetical protein
VAVLPARRRTAVHVETNGVRLTAATGVPADSLRVATHSVIPAKAGTQS